MIDQRVVENTIRSTGDSADAARTQNDGKDGVVVPVGICQVTHTMTEYEYVQLHQLTWCNGPVLSCQPYTII